jgi:hypothetical protein
LQAHALVESLARFPAVVDALVDDLPSERARWRPTADEWSIIEMVHHLVDEEVEDFRARLDRTLDDPGAEWTPVDPERWVVERRYQDADLEQIRARFAEERRASVEWLRELQLGAVNWSAAHEHDAFGRLRAGDLLASWAAHDALHLRGLAQRLYEFAVRDGEGFSATYAGPWSS